MTFAERLIFVMRVKRPVARFASIKAGRQRAKALMKPSRSSSLPVEINGADGDRLLKDMFDAAMATAQPALRVRQFPIYIAGQCGGLSRSL